MQKSAVSALLFVGLSASASGQLIAPPDDENIFDSGLNTVLRNVPRVYEEFIPAASLTNTGPITINGMRFRLAMGDNWRPQGYVDSNWPDVPATFADYTVTLAKAASGLVADGEYLSLSPTFASYLNNPVVVRSGPLTIPAHSFPADGGSFGVHSFGATIPFATSYTLNPGDSLVMLIRLSGYTGGSAQAFFASRFPAYNVADALISTTGATATAPNGFSAPVFVQFVPEPATLALITIVASTMIRRTK